MEFVRREKGRGGGLLYCLIRAARYHQPVLCNHTNTICHIYIGVSYRTGLLGTDGHRAAAGGEVCVSQVVTPVVCVQTVGVCVCVCRGGG